MRAHFGTLSAVTAASSHSGNGLTDLQEYRYGLDPNVWSSAANGIPDGWAVNYGLDPTFAGTASQVAANGRSVLECYQADLNPTNAASRLAFVGIKADGKTVHLNWIGGVNAWQYLECSPTLSPANWTPIFTNVPPVAISNSVSQTIAGGGTNLYYRINAHR